MNPLGYRFEEKKTSIDPEPSFAADECDEQEEDLYNNSKDRDNDYDNDNDFVGSGYKNGRTPTKGRSFDSKSQTSYKSTQSSRSSVLQRAREYSRRIEEQQQQQQTGNSNHSRSSPRRGSGASGYYSNNTNNNEGPGVGGSNYQNSYNSSSNQSATGSNTYPRRSKSLERNSPATGSTSGGNNGGGNATLDGNSTVSTQSNRSKSAGRVTQYSANNNNYNPSNNNFLLSGSRPSTRERALASVRKETTTVLTPTNYNNSTTSSTPNNNRYANQPVESNNYLSNSSHSRGPQTRSNHNNNNTNNHPNSHQSNPRYNSPLSRNNSGHQSISSSRIGGSTSQYYSNNDGRSGDVGTRTPTPGHRPGFQATTSSANNPITPVGISNQSIRSSSPAPVLHPARSPSPLFQQQRASVTQSPPTSYQQQQQQNPQYFHPQTTSNHSTDRFGTMQNPSRGPPVTANRVAGGAPGRGAAPVSRGGNSQSNHNGSRKQPDSPSRSHKSGNTTSVQSHAPLDQQRSHLHAQQQQPVVTPELLVDALSGHEDGLLAIAEKLMEHYDAGYDVMGEAIIDAFADVQKLFQHVVEAAHMEGAAFEASRREEEMVELRRQAAMGGSSGAAAAELIASGVVDETELLLAGSKADLTLNTTNNNNNNTTPSATSPSGPARHDEFIDQDVKDILTEAIRKGSVLRSENKHAECYQLFERACQDASSLLPVDSDHRGRLQLSLARAESMNPDRSCAILRYSMDDVLRSGMRAHRTPLPDPSKRADVVLNRPKGHPSITGVNGQVMSSVIQSSDEALASLIEEMKEILSAPIYVDTPLQGVAKRFWAALADAQKVQQKNEERLEQSLGKLKVEFLLARAEWEEKLSKSSELADSYKEKYRKLKETTSSESYIEQARSLASKLTLDDEYNRDSSRHGRFGGGGGGGGNAGMHGRPGSVASGVSGLAQHAKTLVTQMNNFNCTALNERNNRTVIDDDDTYDGTDDNDSGQYGGNANNNTSNSRQRNQPPLSRNQELNRSGTNLTGSAHRSQQQQASSRSFQDYSKSPKRVDV